MVCTGLQSTLGSLLVRAYGGWGHDRRLVEPQVGPWASRQHHFRQRQRPTRESSGQCEVDGRLVVQRAGEESSIPPGRPTPRTCSRHYNGASGSTFWLPSSCEEMNVEQWTISRVARIAAQQRSSRPSLLQPIYPAPRLRPPARLRLPIRKLKNRKRGRPPPLTTVFSASLRTAFLSRPPPLSGLPWLGTRLPSLGEGLSRGNRRCGEAHSRTRPAGSASVRSGRLRSDTIWAEKGHSRGCELGHEHTIAVWFQLKAASKSWGDLMMVSPKSGLNLARVCRYMPQIGRSARTYSS